MKVPSPSPYPPRNNNRLWFDFDAFLYLRLYVDLPRSDHLVPIAAMRFDLSCLSGRICSFRCLCYCLLGLWSTSFLPSVTIFLYVCLWQIHLSKSNSIRSCVQEVIGCPLFSNFSLSFSRLLEQSRCLCFKQLANFLANF